MRLITIHDPAEHGTSWPMSWLYVGVLRQSFDHVIDLGVDPFGYGGHFFKVVGEYEELIQVAVTIPIPFPFWHYSPQYGYPRYAYWALTLAVRLDERPTREGRLPGIGFATWLGWRKPASLDNTTKTRSRWRSGRARNTTPF